MPRVASPTTPAATSRWNKPNGQRYRSWFGAYDATRWNQAETNFSKIRMPSTTKPLTFDCVCKQSYFAYVYPDQPLGLSSQSFWTAPVTGTDSRAGTIVHELSHFNVVAGTDDLGIRSGNARNLASTDPQEGPEQCRQPRIFRREYLSEIELQTGAGWPLLTGGTMMTLLLTTLALAPVAVRAVGQRRERVNEPRPW